MSKGKRNRNRRRDDVMRWPASSLEQANADVHAAERVLAEARRRAALAANGHKAPAAPEEQAEEFFNRPGDFYIAQFEIPQTTTGGPIRAQCVLKADEAQRDYLVEVMRQVRGGFGEGARISLSRANQLQQRVVDGGGNGAADGLGAAHLAARDAVRRRNEQMLAEGCQFGKPQPQAEVCKAHRDPDCKRCDETVDDLWVHPRDLELTREEWQQQLPGMTRTEVAEELGVHPADIGGDIKGADSIEVEQLAAELGVSPLDLQPIEMRGGGRVYAVKPRTAVNPPGRHARPS